MGRFTGLLGMAVFVGLAYLFSTSRKSIKLKTVLWGLGLATRVRLLRAAF